ncbi:MAG: hypothetical protein M3Z75_01180 [Actinomycetota bacterium]|nr:hypothetical protein [Actinomycetota bacterium]
MLGSQAPRPLPAASARPTDGGGDLYNQMEITANGVLALITAPVGGSAGAGRLLAVGLHAGRLLWSRPYGKK